MKKFILGFLISVIPCIIYVVIPIHNYVLFSIAAIMPISIGVICYYTTRKVWFGALVWTIFSYVHYGIRGAILKETFAFFDTISSSSWHVLAKMSSVYIGIPMVLLSIILPASLKYIKQKLGGPEHIA